MTERTDQTPSYFVQATLMRAKLNVPGLIGFGVNSLDRRGFFVEEYMGNGNLEEMLIDRLNGTLPPEFGPTAFSKVIFGIAAIMSHVHSLHIILRDLTPSSIFLDDRNEPQLVNLFPARFYSDYMMQVRIRGFGQYAAPEQIRNDEITSAVDVYSYGFILYAFFADNLNFYQARTAFELARTVVSGIRPTLPGGIPPMIEELIRMCWAHSADERPSFAEITQVMLERDDFVLDGTNLDEYHEYQQRIRSQLKESPIVDDSDILESLRGLGVDVDSIGGIAR
jgi:serine/threonine protein kinase